MEGNGNGQGDGRVYVRFGPGATQEIPAEWAALMLSAWRARHPLQFGKALAEAAIEAAGS